MLERLATAARQERQRSSARAVDAAENRRSEKVHLSPSRRFGERLVHLRRKGRRFDDELPFARGRNDPAQRNFASDSIVP